MSYEPLQVALYYAALFPARQDIHAIWTDNGWRPVRRTLTPEIVLAGLTGAGPSISGYMIAPGSVSHSLAIDFDIDDGFDVGMRLARKMAEHDIPSYVETSRRGSHLWCILDRVVPAIAIRAALRGLLQSIDAGDDPKIELRPGSDILPEGGTGHALRLPLMPHPKTGVTGRLHDANGASIGRTVAEVLLAIDFAPADALLAWGEQWKRPPVTYIPPDHRNPHEPFPEDDSSASEILRDLWGVPNASPGRVVSCPATEYHSHGDIHKGLKIMPDDKRVICYKGGCILHKDGHGRGTYELRKLAPVPHG